MIFVVVISLKKTFLKPDKDNMSNEANTGKHYDKVNYRKGPKIYSSKKIHNLIFKLGKFSARNEPYNILDAMCGEGLVGKEVSKRLKARAINHEMNFLDLTKKKLAKLRKQGMKVIVASIFKIPCKNGTFDRAYARFGVKNYQKSKQMLILKEFRRVLKPRGIFVLIDLESLPETYGFMQEERKMKNKYADLKGKPHIPTREMWIEMLRENNFEPIYTGKTVSKVTTSDWVKSGQMSHENLRKLNSFLLSAPIEARLALKIRCERKHVKIDYPVVIISAVAI